MKRLKLVVDLEVEETENDVSGDATWLARALVEYMTSPESVLCADYGPKAWGGHDGAYITASTARCEIERAEPIVAETRRIEWPKEES